MDLEFVTAIILLMVAIISLIGAFIGLRTRTRERPPPPSPAEVGPEPAPPLPPSTELEREPTAAPANGRRRTIGQLATWVIGGSAAAIALFLVLAAAGLFAGGYFLSAALEREAPDLEIVSPGQGDVVAWEILVEGKARVRADDEFLVVFVRPMPTDPSQDYWAQAIPQQIDEDRWDARPVYVGVPDDQAGTPFNVCAVITRSQISPGESFRTLPEGPHDCVLVTRE